jgi:hypothetical protein
VCSKTFNRYNNLQVLLLPYLAYVWFCVEVLFLKQFHCEKYKYINSCF